MKLKKLISAMLCVVMVVCSTMVHVTAEDLTNDSTPPVTMTENVVEPVLVDENGVGSDFEEGLIATFSEMTEDEEETEGNYEEEPEVDVEATTNSSEEENAESSVENEGELITTETEASEVVESANEGNDETTVEETTTEESTVETSSETVPETITENSENTETTSANATIEDSEIIASVSEVSNELESKENEVADEVVATNSEIEIALAIVATASVVNENTFVATISEMEPIYKTGSMEIDYTAKRLKPNYYNGLLRAGNIPSSYDSRNVDGVSYVPPIRNQNPYGTCWAFSMAGQAETSAIKKGLVANNNSIDLSEAVVAYYMYNLQSITASGSANIDYPGYEGNDYTTKTDGEWTEGGNLVLASLQISSYRGYVKENVDTSYNRLKDYQYNLDDYTLDGKYAFNSNDFEISNIQFINHEDIAAIKKAVMDNGSVGINYAANSGSSSYNMHVINGEHFYCSNNETDSNHAIMVIGWDDNIPKENFYYGNSYTSASHKITRGNGAWLCRNSWDTWWGDDGYFWISYYETSFSSETFTSIEVIPANTYEYNYHYDTSASPRSYYVSRPIGNVFKVSGDKNQSLDAVSVAIDDTNVTFDIEIYTSDTKMGTPIKGTKKLTQRVSRDLSGIWTIPLNKKIVLNKGTYFSIVIKPVSGFNVFVDEDYIQYANDWFRCYN